MNFIYREGAAVAHGPFSTETEARLHGEEQHRLHGSPVHLLAAVDHLTAVPVPGQPTWSNAPKPDLESASLAGPPVSKIAERFKQHLRSPLLRQLVDARVALGIKKYGQTLDANIKPERAKAVHLIQELTDGGCYGEWLGTKAAFQFGDAAAMELASMADDILDAYPDLTLEELMFQEGHAPVYCSCSGLQACVEMGLIKHQPAQLLDKAGVLHQLSYYHLGSDGPRSVILAYCPSCGERIQANEEFTAFAK